MATNRQGAPFCGPLLNGVDRPAKKPSKKKSPSSSDDPMDLFKVLAKIRRLEYADVASFVADVTRIASDAVAILAGRSKPLEEAAQTLQIICDEQVKSNRTKFDAIEAVLKAEHTGTRSAASAKEKKAADAQAWPFPWRHECMPFGDKYYVEMEAKSIEEWAAYVSCAALYVSCDDLSAMYTETKAASHSNGITTDKKSAASIALPANTAHNAVPATARREFASLSLNDGLDVMMALSELSNSRGSGNFAFAGKTDDDLEETDAREFFLSPSLSEMEQMFAQQSEYLRRALMSHAALQKAWAVSKQSTISIDQGTSLTIGDARLVAELRLANKVCALLPTYAIRRSKW